MDNPRTRAGALDTQISRVSTLRGRNRGKVFQALQLKAPPDTILRPEVQAAFAALTPAAQRMLGALASVLAQNAQFTLFRPHANRAQIARSLRKEKLARYDIQLLHDLDEYGLLCQERRSLPAKTIRGADGQQLRLGAGFEYVYSIPERVLYVLVLMNNPQAFTVAAPAPAPEPQRPAPSQIAAAVAPQPVAVNAPDVSAMREVTPVIERRARRRFGFTLLQWLVLVVLALALLAALAVMVMMVVRGRV